MENLGGNLKLIDYYLIINQFQMIIIQQQEDD